MAAELLLRSPASVSIKSRVTELFIWGKHSAERGLTLPCPCCSLSGQVRMRLEWDFSY